MKLSTKILAVAFVVAIALVVAIPASAASFERNLTVGSTGADVTALQTTLVGGGYLAVNPTGFFGALTKAAVVKYQIANGISGTGFVGPLTRAVLNGAAPVVSTGGLCPNGMTLASNCTQAPGVVVSVPLCPNGNTLASNCSTAPGTVSQNGTDGTLTAAQSSYVSSGIQVKKGETKNVLATTLKASIGPVTVTRAGVHFSARPWLLFSQVILKDSTGRVIATKALNSAADATEITVGSDYLVTFDGVNYTVTPGINQDLTVAVSVLPATDKIPTAGLAVDAAFDTLRTINGIGWTDTVTAATFPLAVAHTASTGSNSFTLTSTGSVAAIYNRISPNSPAAHQVATSLTQQTSNVVLGAFSVKSANNSSTLNTLTVTLASTTLASGPLGNSNFTGAFSNFRLSNGSASYGGSLVQTSVTVGTVTFSNLNIPLAQDVWTDLTIQADVAASTTGTGITVALNGSSGVVVTDSNYGTPDYTSGVAATSNAIVLTTNAITVSNTSLTTGAAIVQSTVTTGYNVTGAFTITNSSNNDLYVSGTSTMLVTQTLNGTATTTNGLTGTITANPSSYNGDVSGGLNASYAIPAGSSRSFTISGAIYAAASTINTLKITAINYGTAATTALNHALSITSGIDNMSTGASF